MRYQCRCSGAYTCPGCENAIDAAESAREDRDRTTMSEREWDAWEAGPGWHSYPGQPGW